MEFHVVRSVAKLNRSVLLSNVDTRLPYYMGSHTGSHMRESRCTYRSVSGMVKVCDRLKLLISVTDFISFGDRLINGAMIALKRK